MLPDRFRPAFLLLATLWVAGMPLRAQHVGGERPFYADDPVWEDPDRLDAPVPARNETSQYYDLLLHTFGSPAEYRGPALNTNTLDEVPNSAWYTNRHYRHPMSIDALARGPDEGEGPDPSGPWTVVDGKRDGATLGLQIVDARGDRYLLKFDPKRHPEMSTGAEVISTKLLYALGYNVPQNAVAYFTRDRLTAGPDATRETSDDEEEPLTEAFIDTLLTHAYRYPDGRYRAMASRFLEGKPLGPFEYYGTRPDDANDVYPHEARRELRGLRVIAAWIHHFDARSANSLDMVVEEDGRTYVRHYLIDFGSTLGAGATAPAQPWMGHEYAFELWPILARTGTLGFGASSWMDIAYPDAPAIGRWEADHFDPGSWKMLYPNPAFRRMDEADAFWAAKQVANLSDEALRAIVSTARYTDPDVERYVADVLIARRDRVAEAYLSFGGGLDRFRVEEGRLRFEDLIARHGLDDQVPARVVRWRSLDRSAAGPGAVILEAPLPGVETPLPASNAPFLRAEIETRGLGTTRVTLRRAGGGYEIVGVDRS